MTRDPIDEEIVAAARMNGLSRIRSDLQKDAEKLAMFDELVDMLAHAEFCATVEIEKAGNTAWHDPRARFRSILERAWELQK